MVRFNNFGFLSFQVPLTPALSAYKELKIENILTFLIPHQPLYPLSKIHVPVFLQTRSAQNIAIFVVRYV